MSAHTIIRRSASARLIPFLAARLSTAAITSSGRRTVTGLPSLLGAMTVTIPYPFCGRVWGMAEVWQYVKWNWQALGLLTFGVTELAVVASGYLS